jgi:hypothetical protein
MNEKLRVAVLARQIAVVNHAWRIVGPQKWLEPERECRDSTDNAKFGFTMSDHISRSHVAAIFIPIGHPNSILKNRHTESDVPTRDTPNSQPQLCQTNSLYI